MLRLLMREPLLHFAVLGSALFAAWLTWAPADADVIEVPVALQRSLIRDYAARTGRTPSAQEREGLVQRWIEDEIMVREAKARALHEGDPIVRRRLAQVMRFLWEQNATAQAPSDAELEAWWQSHRERYPSVALTTLEHVFFSTERRKNAEGDARAALGALASGGSAPRGDPFIHGSHVAAASPQQLGQLFGATAAEQVASFAIDEWRGPVLSPYGAHVIRVHGRESPPEGWQQHRAAVLRDWREERGQRAVDDELTRLRGRYTIVREPMPSEVTAGR